MRSMSAPPQLQRSLEAVQEGIQDVLRLQRWRTAVQRKSVLGVPDEKDGSKETFFSTLDEIFTFIGSDPEKMASILFSTVHSGKLEPPANWNKISSPFQSCSH